MAQSSIGLHIVLHTGCKKTLLLLDNPRVRLGEWVAASQPMEKSVPFPRSYVSGVASIEVLRAMGVGVRVLGSSKVNG